MDLNNKFISKLRRYKLNDILNMTSIYSYTSYNKDRRAFRNINDGKIEVFCGEWTLLRLAYFSLLVCNNNREKSLSESEFNELILLCIEDENSNETKEEDLFYELQCNMYEQFDLQSIKFMNKIDRLYAMFNSSEQLKNETDYMNLHKEFTNIFEMNYYEYVKTSYFIALTCAYNARTLKNILNVYDFDIKKFGIDPNNIKNIIFSISKDIDYYKNIDSNNKEHLKNNPIVKINDDYLIVSIYSLLLILCEYPYWVIRDEFYSKNSNKFLNFWGVCFEKYADNLLDYYHIKYERIKRQNNMKQPDIRIETQKYIFVIEQKASLITLGMKCPDNENRVDDINKKLKQTFNEAVEQLNAYDEATNDKTIIRIVLTYQCHHMEENIRRLIQDKDICRYDSSLYWFIWIDEFEKMMFLLNKNEKLFNKMIEEKIQLEKEKSNKGRRVEDIIQKYGVKNNHYLNEVIGFSKTINDEILTKAKEMSKNGGQNEKR